ncbi:MAG: AAA family ATPase [Candidatus Heimdallarchaeaceae archaeon]
MFSSLTIKNFRGIKNLKINELGQINLIVGKNNSGKSSILDAIFILISPTNPELLPRTNQYRRLSKLDETYWKIFFTNTNTEIPIELEGTLTNKEKRILSITPNKRVFGFNGKKENSFPVDKTKDVLVTEEEILGTSGRSIVISGLDIDYIKEEKEGKKEEIKTSFFIERGQPQIIISKPIKETLRGVYLNPATIFGNISTRLDNIQVKKKMNKLLKILQKIEPSISGIYLGSEGAVYCDLGFENLIPINVLGDGTNRILSILAPIVEYENGIVLIDEIENGIHYKTQETLWKAIFDYAKEHNVQIVATTHSIECVRTFNKIAVDLKRKEDAKLFRIEKREEKTQVISYDTNELSIALEEGWEVR